MALFDEAAIAFTTSLVTYQDEYKAGHVVLPSATRRTVHVTVAQCADNVYGLMVHELVGVPQVLLWRVWVPDPRIVFDCTESERTVSVAFPEAWRFTLKFNAEREFWKVAQILADVKGTDAGRRYKADELLREAAVVAIGGLVVEEEQGVAPDMA